MSDALEQEPDFDYEEEQTGVPYVPTGVTVLSADLFAEDVEEDVVEEAVVPDPNTPPDPTVAELQKSNAALQAQVMNISTQLNSLNSVQNSIDALGNRINTSATPQKPRESDADYATRMKDDYYKDPYNNYVEFNQRVNGPVIQGVVTQTMELQKSILKLDPEKGPRFKKYEKEIDAEFDRTPIQQRFSDPRIYTKIYNVVIAQHADEFIAEGIAAATKGVETPTPNAPTAPRGNYNATSTTKPVTTTGNPPKRTRITAAQVPQYVKDIAHNKGVGAVDCYVWMRDQGLLRKDK